MIKLNKEQLNNEAFKILPAYPDSPYFNGRVRG